MTERSGSMRRLIPILILPFVIAGCSLLKANQKETIAFPHRPSLVFEKLCKDDHNAGVKLYDRGCSEWEYSLDAKEVADLLHYFIEIDRVEALSQ